MALLTVLAADALAAAAAERITSIIEESVGSRQAADRGLQAADYEQRSAFVALTGGATVPPVYRSLADPGRPWRQRIPWRHVHAFWGDERHVPPSDRDSNFGMTAATLLSRVSIPASQIHRMRGELPADEAAREYETELREGFRAAGRPDETFDLMLLGLGANGHIASIFPASPVFDEHARRVAAVWVPELETFRITLTPAALLASRHIVMIVAGAQKADAVQTALEGPLDPTRCPAQLLRAAGDRVEWLIDRAAARR